MHIYFIMHLFCHISCNIYNASTFLSPSCAFPIHSAFSKCTAIEEKSDAKIWGIYPNPIASIDVSNRAHVITYIELTYWPWLSAYLLCVCPVPFPGSTIMHSSVEAVGGITEMVNWHHQFNWRNSPKKSIPRSKSPSQSSTSWGIILSSITTSSKSIRIPASFQWAV